MVWDTHQFTNMAVKGDVGCHISNESGWSIANRPQMRQKLFPRSHEGGIVLFGSLRDSWTNTCWPVLAGSLQGLSGK